MNASLSLSTFRQVTDDLASIEQMVVVAQNLLDDVAARTEVSPHMRNRFDDLHNALNARTDSLSARLKQISLLYNTFSQFSRQLTATEVANLTLEVVWQRAPLSFAAMVVGATELGPYRYQSLRGAPDASRYLGKECPFPLWGALARTLVRRLNVDEPDYLVIADIKADNGPTPQEFPWMPRSGSLLIVPLRLEETTIGALLLGQNQAHAFHDTQLCDDFYDLANLTARTLYHTQLRQEINEREEQLVGLQLFTKSMTNAHTLEQLLAAVEHSVREMLGDVVSHLVLERKRILAPTLPGRLPTNGLHQSASTNGRLHFEETMVLHPLTPKQQPQPIPEESIVRLLNWSMRAGQPVFYEPEGPIANPQDLYYNQSGRGLVVPIFSNDAAIGALHISAPQRIRPFEESDMVVMRTIANMIAVALGTYIAIDP